MSRARGVFVEEKQCAEKNESKKKLQKKENVMLLKKEHSSVLRRCNQSRTDELTILTLHSRHERVHARTKRPTPLKEFWSLKRRKDFDEKFPLAFPQTKTHKKILMDVFNIA